MSINITHKLYNVSDCVFWNNRFRKSVVCFVKGNTFQIEVHIFQVASKRLDNTLILYNSDWANEVQKNSINVSW